MEAQERDEIGAVLGELAAAFSGLVEVLLAGGQARLNPERIVHVAASVMPGCRHAAVAVVEQDQPRTLASTDAVPDHVDAIQFDAGEGPSLDVLVTDDYVRVDDLAADARWPQFGRRAVEVGDVRSMISYRLYLGRHRRGALSFYSTWPHAFDDVAAAIGAIFAAYCSLALITQALGDDVHPRRAAEVHREIGVAIGILMAAEELGVDEAFTKLHSASRRLHRDLGDVAHDVAASGRLPDEPGEPRPPGSGR
ncbi:MAG TPA: GAF and ANTAR domain-containing protein [Pseudonocardiaceae bacterium]|nr:GAF and ANTAR domain-containing protein [Pseudonocardiaceae bacterium]